MVVVEPSHCSIKQGFLIILMKVFSIHFAVTGEESNMYYTSSFYQGFTYEKSPWQLLGPEGEVTLIINLFLFYFSSNRNTDYSREIYAHYP